MSEIQQDEISSDILITVTGTIINEENIDENKYKWM